MDGTRSEQLNTALDHWTGLSLLLYNPVLVTHTLTFIVPQWGTTDAEIKPQP